MKFHKTIRFKLTFWYTLLFIISNLVFVLIANFIITSHYQNRLPDFIEHKPPPQFMDFGPSHNDEFEELMQQTREEDQKQIQRILFFVFIILSGLSCASGYIVAGKMLKPLQKINDSTKKINSQNLDKKIKHEDTGDEISEMINNINQMISRLNKSFSLQKQFIENASHELKTPLAVIQTNLDVAKLNKKDCELNINTALKSTKFMNKLIEDLLLLSLADPDIKIDDVVLEEILQESVDQLALLAKNKNIKINLNLNKKQKTKIKGNKSLLQRAFMNLMENAINYSKPGGEIIIKLKQKDKQNIISVIDNGLGIPKDKIDKVWDRFYRVDKSRSRQSGGTGLGLAITKKIIDLHKGNINIDSVINLGTEVKVTL